MYLTYKHTQGVKNMFFFTIKNLIFFQFRFFYILIKIEIGDLKNGITIFWQVYRRYRSTARARREKKICLLKFLVRTRTTLRSRVFILITFFYFKMVFSPFFSLCLLSCHYLFFFLCSHKILFGISHPPLVGSSIFIVNTFDQPGCELSAALRQILLEKICIRFAWWFFKEMS